MSEEKDTIEMHALHGAEVTVDGTEVKNLMGWVYLIRTADQLQAIQSCGQDLLRQKNPLTAPPGFEAQLSASTMGFVVLPMNDYLLQVTACQDGEIALVSARGLPNAEAANPTWGHMNAAEGPISVSVSRPLFGGAPQPAPSMAG